MYFGNKQAKDVLMTFSSIQPNTRMDDELGSYEGEKPELSSSETLSAGLVCKDLMESEAGEYLHTVGKCESGLGYAYLGLNVSNMGLTAISVIPKFKHVIYVDVSRNELTSEAIQVLSTMKYLLVLRVDNNKLASGELNPMPHLQILTMKKNQLRDTRGIRHELLERLEINHNKIREVEFDYVALKRLKSLELRGNLLTTTRGLSFPRIVHLYLAENSIEKLEGLEGLVALKVLHLRGNKISNLDGFSRQCACLSYLNLRENRIMKVSELEKLSCLPALETLIVQENPAFEQQDEEESTYRRYVLAILPKLKRIDKDPVTYEEKEEAEELRLNLIQNSDTFAQFDADIADE